MKLITAILLLSQLVVFGTNYYVSTNGLDTNPGTSIAPFLTVQKGITTAQAGDSVIIGIGDYAEGPSTARAGTSTNRITIDGQNVASIRNLSLSHAYINVQNLTICSNSVLYGNLLYIDRNASYCVISNNVIDSGFDDQIYSAIRWNNPSTSPFGTAGSYNLFVSNVVKQVFGRPNVVFFGDTNLFYGNTFKDGDTVDWFDGWGRGNMIVANVMSNCFASGLSGNHADVFQTHGSGNYGCYGLLMESNLVHTMAGAGALMQTSAMTTNASSFGNWDIRNNVFVGIANAASVNIRDTRWHNNTFYYCSTNGGAGGGTGGSVISFGTYTNETYYDVVNQSAHGGQILNNVFLNCGGTNSSTGWYTVALNQTNVIADYNYVAKTNGYSAVIENALHAAVGEPGASLYQWWEHHGINGGNPLLANEANGDYSVGTNSFLYAAGTNLSAQFTTDYAGNQRPSSGAWTIGAFEASDADAGVGDVAPAITSQPQSITRSIGQSAAFSVSASGTAPLSYQWRKEGANMAGATATSYVIASVQATNSGHYDAVITNSVGTVTSATATLNVTAEGSPGTNIGRSFRGKSGILRGNGGRIN